MFCQYQKPIFTSLSPNTEKDDIDLALKLLFQPWKWKRGDAIEELENQFKEYLGVKPACQSPEADRLMAGRYAFSFNSGRSAFWAILEALEIAKGDEVLLQAFTCNAAVNPILERGAEPVFVDIDDTLNLDPNDLRKKISSRSKAVMVQHNFGWPAKIEEISKITKDYNLYLIEDCAHSLGAEYKGKKVGGLPAEASAKAGTFGDAAFFSFGRDKIISSIFGGMAVTNNEKLAEKIKEFQEKIDYPSNFWIFQQLLHPILVNYLVIPAYGLGANLGRILLGLSHKLSILSKAVYKKEKRGKIPKYFPKRLPNTLSILALNQFKKLERFNKHRREIANFYQKELRETGFTLPLSLHQDIGSGGLDKAGENRTPTFMRYPILLNPVRDSEGKEKIQRDQISKGVNFDTDEILKKARRRKIYLDDGWRKSPIVPLDTNLEKMKYKLGSCPRAERVAETILNLPTHINISKKDAQKIVDFLKNYGNSGDKK